MMEVVRLFLSADQLNPPGVRYNPTTDTVQTLVDGVWVDTPSADPRTSPGALLPARTGVDAKCDAAANMTAKVKSIIDFYVATADIAVFVGGIIDLILIFFPLFGLVAEVVWTLAEVLLGIGSVAINGAFTSTVYDNLTCYFYSHADASGQLSQVGIDAVMSDITANESGTVATVMSAIFASLGYVGMSNAGAAGSETGDCSGCPGNWCYRFDFTSGTQGWSGGNANYSGGVGWVNLGAGDYPYTCDISLVYNNPSSPLNSVTIEAYSSVAESNAFRGVYWAGGAANAGGNQAGDYELGLTVPGLTNVTLHAQISTLPGTPSVQHLKAVVFRGTGDNPFGVGNCT